MLIQSTSLTCIINNLRQLRSSVKSNITELFVLYMHMVRLTQASKLLANVWFQEITIPPRMVLQFKPLHPSRISIPESIWWTPTPRNFQFLRHSREKERESEWERERERDRGVLLPWVPDVKTGNFASPECENWAHWLLSNNTQWVSNALT